MVKSAGLLLRLEGGDCGVPGVLLFLLRRRLEAAGEDGFDDMLLVLVWFVVCPFLLACNVNKKALCSRKNGPETFFNDGFLVAANRATN